MTDDKEPVEPDAWAGLDADAKNEGGGDDAAFIFDMLGDEPAAPRDPAADAVSADAMSADEEFGGLPGGDAVGGGIDAANESDIDASRDDDGAADAGIPLAVFPRPDAELGHHDEPSRSDVAGVHVDALADDRPAATEPPGIFAMDDSGADAADESADGGLLDPASGERGISAAASAGDDSAGEFLFAGSQDGPAEFSDPAADPPSDEVSFNAGGFPAADASPFAEPSPFAEASPFAEGGQEDPFAPAGEPTGGPSGGEVAAIPIAAAVATATAAAPRKKKSALGQLIGVVLGGVLAIPITYAILLWGFQKDPFKLARQVPEQVAFLVPQSLRQTARPSRPPQPTGPSLDDLQTAPEPATEAAADAAPPAMPADAVADATDPAASPEPKEGAEETDGDKVAMKKSDDGEEAAAANLLALPPDVPAELAEQFRAALARLGSAEDVEAALARITAEPAAPVAMTVEPPVVPETPAAIEPPPVDLTDVETAVAEAAEAFDALEAATDLDVVDRQRLMVGWYRRLATLGEQLALAETAAVTVGRPFEQAPEAVEGMLERIRGSEAAVEDLRTLGRMWLAAQKRRADGIVLVATVESSRKLGPYWSTRVAVAGTDGEGRAATVISRLQPAADIGEPIMITGVLFDADTVWAADTRPLAGRPAVDADMPAIGVPPTFDEPAIPAPVLDPPAKKGMDELRPAAPDADPEPASAKPGRGEPATPESTAPSSESPKPASEEGSKEPDAKEPDAKEPDAAAADEPQPAAS